jgi:hypothetical protein
MLCPNCQTENDDSANFCTNCRTSLKDTTEAAPAAAPATPATPAAPAASTEKPNFFAIMLAGVLKPMTTFKENLAKFADFKNAAILGLIIAGAATIFSTVTTVVTLVRTEECVENCSSSWFSSSTKEKKYETKWKWENLNNIDWFKVVGQTFLVNAFTLCALSGAFFGTAKIMKSEKANFGRMLAVASIGSIPTIVVSFIAPVIAGINATIAGILTMAAVAYSFSIIWVGLNEESGVEGDKKVYLNIIALACIAVAYYILFRIMYGEMADLMFGGLFNLSGGSFSGLSTSGSSSSLDLDSLTNLLK